MAPRPPVLFSPSAVPQATASEPRSSNYWVTRALAQRAGGLCTGISIPTSLETSFRWYRDQRCRSGPHLRCGMWKPGSVERAEDLTEVEAIASRPRWIRLRRHGYQKTRLRSWGWRGEGGGGGRTRGSCGGRTKSPMSRAATVGRVIESRPSVSIAYCVTR